MTTDELRAAAELVVATGTHKDWSDTIDAGALAVCRDWLRLHPADDGEPVTEDWLRSVGFVTDGEYIAYFRLRSASWGHIDSHLRHTNVAVRWMDRTWNANGLGCRPCETRGDLRRLCNALGITLKDGAAVEVEARPC